MDTIEPFTFSTPLTPDPSFDSFSLPESSIFNSLETNIPDKKRKRDILPKIETIKRVSKHLCYKHFLSHQIPFHVDITIEKIGEEYVFTTIVPGLKYHNISKAILSTEMRERNLFYCVIETTGMSQFLTRKYCRAQNRLGFSTELGLHIRYMNSIVRSGDIRIDERNILRGIERRALDISLQYITFEHKIDTEKTIIMYTPKEECKEDDIRLKKYMSIDYNTLASYYCHIFPDKTPTRLITTQLELAKSIIEHEEVNKVKLYASNMLGMIDVDKDTMATSLSILLEKCI